MQPIFWILFMMMKKKKIRSPAPVISFYAKEEESGSSEEEEVVEVGNKDMMTVVRNENQDNTGVPRYEDVLKCIAPYGLSLNPSINHLVYYENEHFLKSHKNGI